MREWLKNWQEAGLITADQVEAITTYEALAERRRVSPREIFVYIGGFFVLMAVGFGLQVLWDQLRSLGRLLVIAVPILILWAVGEALRRRAGPLLKRGAQVLWMVAAWLTAVLIVVILVEWPGLELKGGWLMLWGSLGALPLAIIALLVLPGLPQGLAAATLASGVAAGITIVVGDAWADQIGPWVLYPPWLVGGALGLAAAEIAHRRKKASLMWLFNLFGAGSCLIGAQIINMTGRLMGRLPAWETYLPWLVGGALGLGAAELARRRQETSLIWLFNLFGAGSCLIGALTITMMAEKANIYVMDADGSNQTRLTQDSARGWSPAWSPDGSRFAFGSRRDGNPEIYLMDADGSNQTRLTKNSAGGSSPAWSPNGSRIAFESWRDGNEDIYVMDADGSNQTNLTQGSAGGWSPAWSPDGSRFAFGSYRDGNEDIYVMDADGSNQTRLTRNPAVDRSPAWSPDGSRIAFVSTRDRNEEIYVMDAAGSNQTRLTENLAADLFPAWSPDGGRIAFETHRERGTLPAWQTLLLIESLVFIAWSVARQSRALLYSGALFLFLGIVQISFEYFAHQLGLPVVLLIIGVALIAIGLGVDRLRRLEAGT